MLRQLFSVCLFAGIGTALAAVPPMTYSGGTIGKVVMTGDFPTNTIAYGWYPAPIYHGDDGWYDTLSTVHFSGLTPIVAAVDFAELRIGIHSYTTRPNIPGFRVYARKGVSPASPSTAPSEWPNAYYRSGSGWTSAYATLEPVDGDVGMYRLDITDIVNELALQSGGTGASITFIFEPTHTPDGVRACFLRFTTASTIKIYPDLKSRDYQRHAIVSGTTIFYIPLDATDLGANGSAVTSFRSVVAANGADKRGVDQYSTTNEHGLSGIASTADYALHTTSEVFEVSNNPARKLVAPHQELASYQVGDDSGPAQYYWPVKTSTKSYLTVVQFVQTGSRGNSWQWDLYDTWGFGMWLTEENSGQVTAFGTDGFSTWPDSPYIRTWPSPFRGVSGEITTMCMYYDASTDRVYLGYHNGEPGAPMAWTEGETVSGSPREYPVSGLRLLSDSKLQGVAGFEWTRPRRLAEVKAAVERARVLWLTGVKALPPMLY